MRYKALGVLQVWPVPACLTAFGPAGLRVRSKGTFFGAARCTHYHGSNLRASEIGTTRRNSMRHANAAIPQRSHDLISRRSRYGRITWLAVSLAAGLSTTVTVAGDVVRDRWANCGLQWMWQTQSAADGYLANVEYVVPHVSSTRSREVFEVVSGEQRTAFIPEELDRFGQPWGVAGAARQADIQQRTLAAQGQPATVENRQIPETTLYLQTSLGALQAIQAETGRVRWSVALGSARLPSIAPSVDDQHLLASFGSSITLLDSVDGRLLWQRPIASIPGSSSVVFNEKAWVPRLRGSIDVFSLSASRQSPDLIMSIGRATSPLSISRAALAWATDAGYLYVLDPAASRPRLRLQVRDLVSAPLTQDGGGILYIATDGGLVLSVDANEGIVRWQNLVDGAVHQAALLLEDAVCLVTDTGWLVCLDAASGEMRWQRRGIESWVARGKQRLLVVDDQNNLVAIDAANGEVQGKSPLQELRPLVSQAMTDRVYLTNGYGQVAALRPVDQPWTNIYVPLGADQPEVVERSEEPAAAEPAKPPVPEAPQAPVVPSEPAGTEDPFADPFGGDFDNPFE